MTIDELDQRKKIKTKDNQTLKRGEVVFFTEKI